MQMVVRLYDAMRRGLISKDRYQEEIRRGRSPDDKISIEVDNACFSV